MPEPDRIETEVILEVPAGYRDAARLDAYISSFVMNATRNKVQKAIKTGLVSINGVVIKKVSTAVTAGDRIVCRVMKSPPIQITPEPIPIDVRFEDDQVLVVNKAAGMVVHPAYGNRSGTLVNALLHYVGAGPVEPDGVEPSGWDDGDEDDLDADDDLEVKSSAVQEQEISDSGSQGLSHLNGSLLPGNVVRPGIVHRLDKGTSGLLVVAKNDVAHARLSAQFADRTISRRYVAIVWGRPTEDNGTIDLPIARSLKDRKKMAVAQESEGKRAVTHYRVEERFAHFSVVHLKLETGRTHQIRVHLEKLGHPVLGDTTYGGATIRSGPDTRSRQAFIRNLLEKLPRQALHAAELTFVHPSTGNTINVSAPLPDDIEFVLERIRTVEP